MARNFSVIVPSKTASNLVPCVQAIRKHEPGARIIVVDDGLDLSGMDAHSETHCWLCDMDPTLRIPGEKPFIFARNVNLGIKAAAEQIDVTTLSDTERQFIPGRYNDVVLLNDDALLETRGGFTALSKAAEDHPEYGLISSTTNCAGNPRQFPRSQGLRLEGDTVAFVCVYIPRVTIEKVGLLDERFVTYGWEDNDYCRRVRMAGLKVGIFDGCFVDHRRLKSTFRGHPGAAGDIEPGRRIFNAKWGL